jgi:hypothetical protein
MKDDFFYVYPYPCPRDDLPMFTQRKEEKCSTGGVEDELEDDLSNEVQLEFAG